MDAKQPLLLVSMLLAGAACSSGLFAAEPAIPKYERVADWPKLPATLKLAAVSGVATDSAGRVYILQRTQPPVVVFDSKGEFLRTWGEGLFKTPHGLRIDRHDNVWMTDMHNHIVLKCDTGGQVLLSLGKKGEPGLDPEHFNKPSDVAIAPNGDFFVTDGYGNSRVVKFSPEGKYLAEWGKKGKEPGEFVIPHSAGIDSEKRLYIGDRENKRVQVFDLDGKFIDQFQETGAPYGLSLTKDRLFIADGLTHNINVLTLQGRLLGSWNTGEGEENSPHWVHVDPEGTVYITYVGGKRVDKFVAK